MTGCLTVAHMVAGNLVAVQNTCPKNDYKVGFLLVKTLREGSVFPGVPH